MPRAKSDEERLREVEVALAPMLLATEEAASAAERMHLLLSWDDPRGTLLAAMPLLAATAVASALLVVLGAIASLSGGWANLAFAGTIAAAVANMLSFHRAELFAAWKGDELPAVPRGVGPGSTYDATPFRGAYASGR